MSKVRDQVNELARRRTAIEKGGGDKAIEKQHDRGKWTARERIEYFFDPGTFMEMDLFSRHIGREFGMAEKDVPADGIIIGCGKVDGRPVAAFAEDFTCMGGTFGERHGKKMNKIIEFGMRNGMPVVGLSDSGGARLQENMGPLSEYGKLFYLNSIASGVVPQIAVLLGPVAGGQAYSPGLNDFLIMARNSAVTFIAGPPLVKAVTGEEIDAQSLGGPDVHSTISGSCPTCPARTARPSRTWTRATTRSAGARPSTTSSRTRATPRTTCTTSSARSSTAGRSSRSTATTPGR
jgi:acetyl-CoA carboxylase carboxyltransferase component